jgi:hypothetical protein
VRHHHDAPAGVLTVQVVEKGSEPGGYVGEGLAAGRAVGVFAGLVEARRLVREALADRRPGQHLELTGETVHQPVVGAGSGQRQPLGGDSPGLPGPQVGRGDHHLGELGGGEAGQPAADGAGLLDAEVGQLHIGVPARQAGFEEVLLVGAREGDIGRALPVPDQDQLSDHTHDPTLTRAGKSVAAG